MGAWWVEKAGPAVLVLGLAPGKIDVPEPLEKARGASTIRNNSFAQAPKLPKGARGAGQNPPLRVCMPHPHTLARTALST